jgi:hypothetical protein
MELTHSVIILLHHVHTIHLFITHVCFEQILCFSVQIWNPNILIVPFKDYKI